MKITPWYLAALAPFAAIGCSGAYLGHAAVVVLTIGIFLGHAVARPGAEPAVQPPSQPPSLPPDARGRCRASWREPSVQSLAPLVDTLGS